MLSEFQFGYSRVGAAIMPFAEPANDRAYIPHGCAARNIEDHGTASLIIL
jgi:hypothetical protein